MALAKILWVDDEIESLQSQKMFLENKGYEVHTLTNGFDAIDFVKENPVDVVLLDETMPGITGLETLSKIKEINQQIPVVLITKNETENLMDEAIGSQISDYLIKPVNPNQVWLSLKKIIDNKRLVAEKTTVTLIITSGWKFTVNSLIGNWKWKKAIARKCRKYISLKKMRLILNFLNLCRVIMHLGLIQKVLRHPL
jgi:DNA-binding NtrC family response regulator